MENTPDGGVPDDTRSTANAAFKTTRGMSEDEIARNLGISDSEASALVRRAALLQDPEEPPSNATPSAETLAQPARQGGVKQVRDDAAILALNLKDAYRLLASFVETAHHAAVALDSYLDANKINARTVKDLVVSLNDISRHYFLAQGEISNPEWAAKTRRLFDTLGDVERGEDYDRDYFKGNHEEIVRALSRSVDPAKRLPRA